MGEASDDDEVRQRVRDAILKAGGVPQTATRTGIPAKTLENYLAKRSTPSLDRAAKIAAAAGMRVGELVGERPNIEASPRAVSAAAEIVRLVGEMVSSVYKSESAKLPESALIGEISSAYASVLDRMDDPSDIDEARELMPWLERRLRKTLSEAAGSPGTGKREAS
mgnify:CR=1 FL=1